MERLDRTAFAKLKGDVPARWKIIRASNSSAVRDAFDAGYAVNAIATQLNLSRACVNTILAELGIDRPSVSEGNRRQAAMATEADRVARASAAHEAVRMIGRNKIAQGNHAARKQVSGDYIGMGEAELAEQLIAKGLKPIPQAAVEGYNIDLLCDRLAVEVHNYTDDPANRTQRVTKTVKLLCAGISVIYVKTGPQFQAITDAAINQIIAFHDLTSRNPSGPGQYRVVRGDGKVEWSSERHLDELASVMATYAALKASAKD